MKIINYIMTTKIFGQLLHQYDENEGLYLTNSKTLVKHIQNWKYNRPQDQARIGEICDYIQNTKRVEGIIYIGQLLDKNKNISYVCYDGNHRLKALSQLEEEYKVVVNVLFYTTDYNIKLRFESINKANPVPEIYIEEESVTTEEKIEILNIVKRISEKWPKHQSSSRNPKRPNFNRDKLTDQISDVLKTNKGYKEEEIWKRIIELNQKYKDGYKLDVKNISSRITNKCKNNDCYIFLKNFTQDLFE